MSYDTDYTLLLQQADALIAGEPDALANIANLCALLSQELEAVNWAGLYVLRAGELVLHTHWSTQEYIDWEDVCGADETFWTAWKELRLVQHRLDASCDCETSLPTTKEHLEEQQQQRAQE